MSIKLFGHPFQSFLKVVEDVFIRLFERLFSLYLIIELLVTDPAEVDLLKLGLFIFGVKDLAIQLHCALLVGIHIVIHYSVVVETA